MTSPRLVVSLMPVTRRNLEQLGAKIGILAIVVCVLVFIIGLLVKWLAIFWVDKAPISGKFEEDLLLFY